MRVLHEDGRDDDVARFARLGRVLAPQLRELEQHVLVQLDAPLQDAQEEVERVVRQRRLDDVQQRLVLDEPLLDVGLLERQEALVRGGDRRRPAGHGRARDALLVRQVQLVQLVERHFVRLHDAIKLLLDCFRLHKSKQLGRD